MILTLSADTMPPPGAIPFMLVVFPIGVLIMVALLTSALNIGVEDEHKLWWFKDPNKKP